MVKNTYGTGCFMLMNTGATATPSTRGLLTTIAWDNGGGTTFALEGSIFMAGAITQWLRDGLGIIKSAGEIEALAASVRDSGGVSMVPAFSGLGAPWWDPGARGTLLGTVSYTHLDVYKRQGQARFHRAARTDRAFSAAGLGRARS